MSQTESDADDAFTRDRETYFKYLGTSGEEGKDLRERALERAHMMRTLEIELYWKRSTYFWGFQLAAFAGFGTGLEAFSAAVKSLSWTSLPMISFQLLIALFGLISAYISLLGAKASKQWQLNWERHVDMLQEEFEGKIYRLIFRDNASATISVTGLNVALAKTLLFCWAVIAGMCAFVILKTALETTETSLPAPVAVMSGLLVICLINLPRSNPFQSAFRYKALSSFGRHILIERKE